MHPRELSRNMESVLKLPAKVKEEELKRNKSRTKKQQQQQQQQQQVRGTAGGEVRQDVEVITTTALPLEMRNQRYQIHFLESLQVFLDVEEQQQQQKNYPYISRSCVWDL
jgi:hypothetical protein